MLTIGRTSDGRYVSTAELAATQRAAWPKLYCDACDCELIPRLGKKRRHHLGHKPGAECYANSGEGQLHLEAKLHLRGELAALVAAAAPFLVLTKCGRCRLAPIYIPLVKFHPGDEVVVERQSQDSYRPDLMVKRAGQILVVVEVVVTNACDEVKWAMMLASKIPAVEVRATKIIGDGGTTRWRGTHPLAGDRYVLPDTFACPPCLDMIREERRAAEADEERRRARAAAAKLADAASIVGSRPTQPIELPPPAWSPTLPGHSPPLLVAVGFCIRCRARILLNPEQPLCPSCFRDWCYVSPNYLWEFCHSCGRGGGSSRARPRCGPCFRLLR